MKLPQDHTFHTKCFVTINSTHLFIKPVSSDVYKFITIDRSSLEVRPSNQLPSDGIHLGEIEGIIGIKHIIKRSYLLAIRSSTCIDNVNQIYAIDSIAVFPIQDVPMTHDESYRYGLEWQWEEIYLKMLSDLFKTCKFYYSACYDLTNSLQKNTEILGKLRADESYQYSDPRFQWNYNVLELFDPSNKFICKSRLPIIMGFITDKYLDEKMLYRWQLISRRGTHRAGTRFNRRGVDENGDVANFVETEQILFSRDGESSYVQIRGSIPLYWSQTPSYKYKPPIEIYRADHEAAMEKHYRDLKANYGEVSVACLIDQRGHEAELAREFNKRMSDLQTRMKISYHYFDFHKECSKMRWHRLNILLKDLIPEIDSYGLFFVTYNNGGGRNFVTNKQTGVVRSNCIDSLDRTNVVQSMIAQYMLDRQLRGFDDNASLSSFPKFMDTFKNAWADNADALSIQYAGTSALKTDFTRTGRRTYAGVVRDGLNSATRYVSNNYLDNYRQDSFDLLLGNFNGYPSPTYKPIDLASYSSAFPIAVIMFTLVAFYVYFRYDSLRWLEN